MKTKFSSFVVALALAAVACAMPGQLLSGLQDPPSQDGVQNASPTPTSTDTDTPTPSNTPTNTPTDTPTNMPVPPTSTPTPHVAWLKIVADDNVIIRKGPCYQTPLAQAKPGSVFPVTGWYRSPQGEEWLRIEFTRNGERLEGWVRSDLVEVTNSDLVPRVFENCPPTPTPTTAVDSPTVAVYRWFHADELDWVTIPEGMQPDSVWTSWGYTKKTFLFYAWTQPFNNSVAVYRWYHPGNKDWATIPEVSVADAVLISHGYQHKTFLFYAATEAIEGSVPVNRWWHPNAKDWVDITKGSIPPKVLMSHGYQEKTFLFYAATKP
jgi:hypothetical protein